MRADMDRCLRSAPSSIGWDVIVSCLFIPRTSLSSLHWWEQRDLIARQENVAAVLVINADRDQRGLPHRSQFGEADDQLIEKALERAAIGQRFRDLRGAGQVLEIGIETDFYAHMGARSESRSAVQRLPCIDRKSTRLNSSHLGISYAVFC